MNFTNQNKFVCCVWPGFSLPLGKNGNDLVHYFKQNYDIDIEYLEQTKTLAGGGTMGSRIDQIFNVKEDSLANFDNIKEEIGALYAKEIVQQKEHRNYKERIYLRYFKQMENELLKSGELTNEDVYQTLF